MVSTLRPALRKQFSPAYGSTGMRDHRGRESWQQVADVAAGTAPISIGKRQAERRTSALRVLCSAPSQAVLFLAPLHLKTKRGHSVEHSLCADTVPRDHLIEIFHILASFPKAGVCSVLHAEFFPPLECQVPGLQVCTPSVLSFSHASVAAAFSPLPRRESPSG